MEIYSRTCVLEEDREPLLQAVSAENLLRELSRRDTFHFNYRVLCGGELRYFQMKAVRAGECPWQNF